MSMAADYRFVEDAPTPDSDTTLLAFNAQCMNIFWDLLVCEHGFEKTWFWKNLTSKVLKPRCIVS
jgi:hypothetical protein